MVSRDALTLAVVLAGLCEVHPKCWRFTVIVEAAGCNRIYGVPRSVLDRGVRTVYTVQYWSKDAAVLLLLLLLLLSSENNDLYHN